MNRTTLSLLAATTALAAVTGVAALAAPGETPERPAAAAERLPVERSELLCPEPSLSELAETDYTSFTPEGGTAGSAGTKGTAGLLPAGKEPGTADGTDGTDGKKDDKESGGEGGGKDGGKDAGPEPVAPLKKPGTPAVASVSEAGAPALVGTADGALAPGWTAQQTTVISSGQGRGVLGVSCTAPDTDFWFPAASTAESRQDYVELTNPDDAAAVVDLELYGKKGPVETETGEGITVPPRSAASVLLSTLTSEKAADLAVHVVARSGRVGAAVRATDSGAGSDWLPFSAVTAGPAVLPGIPADATSVRLVAVATGDRDADLGVELAGPTGSFTPAGHENLTVKRGMATSVDLDDITKGEPGSLVLTPVDGADPAPYAVALRVVRGKGRDQETAFIPATGRIEARGTVADNRAKGSVLSLVAPGRAAKVKVTASAGSGGGEPVSKEYTIKAGTTLSVPKPPAPADGKGTHALTVEALSGGPVYASRMLELPKGGVPMFTVQPVADDRGTVVVPEAAEDLSLLMR
ncbi:hypothetical protein KBZ10_22380 [Streptomyces sp. F63]|uniref:DUF5719 family protein n=1 Tax=Streptomyces sp. F63 TaxID=2824887 RepID=UPI001B379FAB|nr:DUF5719 family protein [Streptomyces sp. F63]MBQ0987214.1 hypothetical protein [Streptomyces sp. F63]